MPFSKLFPLLLSFSLIAPIAVTAEPLTNLPKQMRATTGGQISEKAIQGMIADIQAGVKNKNTSSIVKYYAPFISSQLTITTDSRTESFELDGLAENRSYLENAMKNIKAIEVLSENWDVDILASDEMALVKRNRVIGLTANDGRRYIIDSQALARVAMVDGQLKIISIRENAEVSRRPN